MKEDELNYIMSEEKIGETAIRRLIAKVSGQPKESAETVTIGGALGREAQGFISLNESILSDLEQTMFIKRFIARSVQDVRRQFEGREEQMLADFCDDEKIFRELEESNQLDIKGRLTRLLEQLPQGLPLLPPPLARARGARAGPVRVAARALSLGKAGGPGNEKRVTRV